MKLTTIPTVQAVGAILVHNIVGPDGRKLITKGRQLTSEDVDKIRALGQDSVYVAMPEMDDVREDDAAARLATLVGGEGLELSKPTSGRVNFYAAQPGFLRVNAESLQRINGLQGVTLATLPDYTRAAPKKMVATLKTIGLTIPKRMVSATDAIVHQLGQPLRIAPLRIERVAVLLTGSENGRARVQETFGPPIRARIEELGAHIIAESYTAEDADAVAAAITDMLGSGAQFIIIAGETSIMDADDITPRGIKQVGGTIEVYGAPVEPGNLMLLAYRDAVPILGAPGCVKSREKNVVDLVLPRLFAGERVTRGDVTALGLGGLLIG